MPLSARVQNILRACGVANPPTDFTATQDNAIIKEILGKSPSTTHFLGSSPENKVEVDQWLSFSSGAAAFTVDHAKSVNKFLSSRSFLAGTKLSLADISVFLLADEANCMWSKDATLNHLTRWFSHVQYSLKRPSSIPLSRDNTELPLALFVPSSSSVPASTTNSAPVKVHVAAAPAAAPAAESNNDGNKKEKKEKPPAAPVPSAAGPEPLDPSKLDIKCGVIVKCWDHPDSDKLLCEEIDVGEPATRQIASGLRPHYTAEQMTGKSVLVMANLKDRKIGGFNSQGMVLCASNAEHTVIKLLEPPSNAKAGDRVVFTGFTGEPASSSQMTKKKILEGLIPELKTDKDGVATWNGHAFTIGSANVTSALPSASIS